MTRSDDRRAILLDRLADFVLAKGLAAASLRPLAQAAGLSDRMLLYYFKDKSEILVATLEVIAGRLVKVLEARTSGERLPFDALRAALAEVVLDATVWPYLCLWLDLASLSARHDPLFSPIAEQIGRGFLAWGEAQLDSPDAAARQSEAARLLVMTEGLVFVQAIGMADTCRVALKP
ncbi:MAG: TetR/AcrR family transcriptional regulator [Polymorphobacter sp.]